MVKFAETLNQTFEFSTKEYVTEDLWYTKEDFRLCQNLSKELARSGRRQGYGVLVEQVFARPSRDTLEKLTAISQLDDERCFRGMEHYLDEQHDEERTALQQKAIAAVMECQDLLRQRDCWIGEEDLSGLYAERSRLACQFARRLAKADAIAAREGDNPQKALQFMSETEDPQKVTRWSSWGSVSTGAPQAPRRSLPSDLLKGQIDSARQCLEQDAATREALNECPSSPASPIDELLGISPHLLRLSASAINDKAPYTTRL